MSLCSFVFAKRPERPCISLDLLLYSHWCMKGSDTARVSPVLRTFMIVMYCDAVTVSFCSETVWKCHYRYAVWTVLTLKKCHHFGGHLWSLMYCDAVTVSLCNETLWTCDYTVSCLQPCISFAFWCIHVGVWRVLTLQDHFFGHLSFMYLRRCESVFIEWDAVPLWKCQYFQFCVRKASRASLH